MTVICKLCNSIKVSYILRQFFIILKLGSVLHFGNKSAILIYISISNCFTATIVFRVTQCLRVLLSGTFLFLMLLSLRGTDRRKQGISSLSFHSENFILALGQQKHSENNFILWVLFLYRFGAERFPYSLFRGPLAYPYR